MTTGHVEAPLRVRPRAGAVGQPHGGRSLGEYLLLPRPKDLGKAVIVPLTFGIGSMVSGGLHWHRVAVAALVWAALELLVYQARYQWNDIRGFAADQRHPDRLLRGRLPGPVERARLHVAASVGVAALRVGLTLVLAVSIPSVTTLVMAMTAGVFGVAVIYEFLRSVATGHGSTLPVRTRPALVALWVFVGAGYAVRGMTGLALAVDLGHRPGVIALATVAMWALGVVFVTCRWTLETMCLASVRDGRVQWAARPDAAREHTLGLLRWVDPEVDPHHQHLHLDIDLSGWRVLQGRTPLDAPWNLAFMVAVAAAAWCGRLLVLDVSARDGILSALAAAAAAVVVMAARSRMTAVAVASSVGVMVQLTAGVHDAVVASLPGIIVLVAYLTFTRQCAAEIGHPLRRLGRRSAG